MEFDRLKFICRGTVLALLLVLTVACGDESGEDGDCGDLSSSGYLISDDGSCRLLSWNVHDLPITMTLETSLPDEVIAATRQAALTWNISTGLELFKITTANASSVMTINYTTNIVGHRKEGAWLDAPIEGKKNEPAKTVYYYRDYIYNSNVFFYDEFISGKFGNYDYLSIALHELGHVIGLDHDDTTDPNISIMKSKIKVNEKRTLTERDILRIRSLYAPAS